MSISFKKIYTDRFPSGYDTLRVNYVNIPDKEDGSTVDEAYLESIVNALVDIDRGAIFSPVPSESARANFMITNSTYKVGIGVAEADPFTGKLNVKGTGGTLVHLEAVTTQADHGISIKNCKAAIYDNGTINSHIHMKDGIIKFTTGSNPGDAKATGTVQEIAARLKIDSKNLQEIIEGMVGVNVAATLTNIQNRLNNVEKAILDNSTGATVTPVPTYQTVANNNIGQATKFNAYYKT